MKNFPLRAELAAIAPVLLFVLVIIYSANATTISPVLRSTYVGLYSDSDTCVYTDWITIDRDSLYKWLIRSSSGANFATMAQVQVDGAEGDTFTVDSVNATAATERYVSTINGDSLMDMGWRQWTSYSADARTALKKAGVIKYRLIIRTYSIVGTPAFQIYRVTE